MEAASVTEYQAGPDQVIVVYQPADVGYELNPDTIFATIAQDAERRAQRGEWIVSMTVLPLRHAGTAFGNSGSGYETKTAVAVAYGRVSREAPTPDR